MQPDPPFWFKQRQGKAEPAGDNVLRLTAPNMKESFIAIRREGDRYTAALLAGASGPDLAATPAEFQTPENAWEAAFELYRTNLVT
jgi:hypothetical protein